MATAPKSKKVTTASKASTVVIRSSARYMRTSAQKMRLIADMVRGSVLQQAIDELPFVNKAAARMLVKVLRTAAANAQHNYQYEAKDVKIATITVNEGPVLKRFMPRAQGRATELLKRMCHVEVRLVPIAEAKKSAASTEAKKTESATAEKSEKKKPAVKKSTNRASR